MDKAFDRFMRGGFEGSLGGQSLTPYEFEQVRSSIEALVVQKDRAGRQLGGHAAERRDFAKAAMQGLLSYGCHASQAASQAIYHADALLAELEKDNG